MKKIMSLTPHFQQKTLKTTNTITNTDIINKSISSQSRSLNGVFLTY